MENQPPREKEMERNTLPSPPAAQEGEPGLLRTTLSPVQERLSKMASRPSTTRVFHSLQGQKHGTGGKSVAEPLGPYPAPSLCSPQPFLIATGACSLSIVGFQFVLLLATSLLRLWPDSHVEALCGKTRHLRGRGGGGRRSCRGLCFSLCVILRIGLCQCESARRRKMRLPVQGRRQQWERTCFCWDRTSDFRKNMGI